MNAEPQTSAPVKRPRWPGHLLGLGALATGAAVLATASVQPCGWGVYTRPFLALFALAGGVLILVGDPWWKWLLRLWALAQVAVVVVDPSGPLTRQAFVWFAWEQVSRTSVDGQVIEATGYGVNFAALALFLFIEVVISRRWHAVVPVHLWQFQVLRLARSLFVLCTLGLLAFVGWTYHPLFLQNEPLLVIDAPPPGAEVWAGDRRLGGTPLVITRESLVEWGLSKSSRPPACALKWSLLEEGLDLTGNSATTNLLLKAPGWCAKQFVSFASAWGPRALPRGGAALTPGSRVHVPITTKAQAGVAIDLGEPLPLSCAPGREADFTIVLRRNPPDPHAAGTGPAPTAARAVLKVTFQKGSIAPSTDVPLPAEWLSPPVGAALRHGFKVKVPGTPGRYLVRFSYLLYGGAGGGQRLDHGMARTYAFIEVK